MWRLFYFISALVLCAGCAMPREPSRTPRTAIEQLLLSEAVARGMTDLTIPLPDHSSISVEVIGFGTDRFLVQESPTTTSATNQTAPPSMGYRTSHDFAFVRDMLAGRLAEHGFAVREPSEHPSYRLRVLVHSLGTEQGLSFFGTPPASVLLLFPIPELPLYKAQNQYAHFRYSIDVYEADTGRLLFATPWYRGSSYYNVYTVLLVIMFARTDLPFPPS